MAVPGQVITIRLNRLFLEKDNTRKHINKVHYGVGLTIPIFGGKEARYYLHGILCHDVVDKRTKLRKSDGTVSANRGHYYAYVCFGPAWYKCDDESVSSCGEEDVLAEHERVYMLFYVADESTDYGNDEGMEETDRKSAVRPESDVGALMPSGSE